MLGTRSEAGQQVKDPAPGGHPQTLRWTQAVQLQVLAVPKQQQVTLPGVTTTFSFAPCRTVRLNVSTSSRNALSEGKPKASAVSPFELPLQTPSSEERDTRDAGYERAALCSDLPEQKRDLLQHTEVKWEAGSPAHLGSPR